MITLVDYSSSSDGSDAESVSKKRKFENPQKRLPLPGVIKSLNNQKNQREDDPGLHDGRIRSFQHERGIWATYIYFPCARNDTILELQEALITHCAKELNLKLYPVDDYHISLTRTVVLRHHWIQMFMASIKSNLEVCEKSTCILDCIRIYNNDEKTRSFIGISVAKEDEPKLMQIIQRLDLCLAEFNLEKFYENPSFHISLLWCTYSEELQNCVKKFNDIFESILTDNEDNSDMILKLDVIHGKCGNKVFTFPL